MKLSPLQFFAVWAGSVEALAHARAHGDLAWSREVLTTTVHELHGPRVAREALVYFERLIADVRSGISSL